MNTSKIIWFDSCGTNWMTCFPLGCGSRGAIVNGRIDCEDIILNQDTFSAGTPYRNQLNQIGDYIGYARELVDDGDYHTAMELIEKRMLGEPPYAYLPLAHMNIDFSHKNVSDYKRVLDLSEAIYTCDYIFDGVKYHREGFISHPHTAFVQRFSADAAKLSFTVSLSSDIRSECTCEAGILKLKGRAPVLSFGGSDRNFKKIYDNSPSAACNRFEVWLDILTDGEVSYSDEGISVNGATYAELYQVSDTSFVAWNKMPDKDASTSCAALLERAMSDGYEKVKALHIQDYSSLFSRTEITLEQNENSALPTNLRREKFALDSSDHELCALYFHFGRYLMIASEREDSMPGNLQGIWNWESAPIWECDMHLNINLQMNYWGVESANLSECRLSLLRFLKDLCESGKLTAANINRTGGSCAYSVTDLWCKTTPVGGCAVWAYWPMGEAWLAMDIFDHYEYTKDIAFLDEYFDVLRENAIFLYDWFYFDKKLGYYVSSPSTSPEHSFYYVNENGERYDSSVSKASTGDLSIAREIFSDFIKASRLLGRDEELASRIEKKLESLYPFRRTDDGALAEWSEDFEANELGHRHFSHLIGVYPANVINENTPEIFEAAKLALFKRLDNGSGETGWSAVWALILLSKFGASERVDEYIRKLLIDSSASNLLGYMYIADRPVSDVFQIDGNLGAVAAFAELFLQSDGNIIDILPCVPQKMKQGAVRGLRARGAVSVDIEWCDGKISFAQITPDFDGEYTVRYNGITEKIYAHAGNTVKLFAKDQ